MNFGRCEAVLRVFSVIGGRGDFSAACGRPMTIDNGKNEKHKKLHVTLLPTFSSMFSAKNNIFIRCVFKNQSDFDEIIINYINIKYHDFGTWTQRSASLKIWPVPSTNRYPKIFFLASTRYPSITKNFFLVGTRYSSVPTIFYLADTQNISRMIWKILWW